jgi:HAD superfamily hydrolase (TIGR01484 family)
MGKPFEKELLALESTFRWALEQDTSKFEEAIKSNLNTPLICVGSGGSFSACSFAVLLYQHHGTISKAVTPLDLNYSKEIIRNLNLLFISASGKNTDIILAFKKAIEQEPSCVTSLCMRKGTPLSKLSEQYSVSKTYEYDIPSGKDGFLATNSLIAFFTLLYKAFDNNKVGKNFQLSPDKKFVTELKKFIGDITPNHTFITLYGSWGQPVAVDLESKFSEAALGNIFISDYRNFGHGRHHWFAKRGKQSAVIAIVSPEEEAIALKTLDLLPKEIPKLIIKSANQGALSSIDLLAKSFYLVNELGKIQNIDPGKPGVPSFGSKLYNLRYSNLLRETEVTNPQTIAIKRKISDREINQMSSLELKHWVNSYNKFKKAITSAKFGSIIFDYDGTLCSHENRMKTELTPEITQALTKILKNGFIVGVVTGRGKSVRELLQKSLNKTLWNNVIIGYYNGSDIGALNNNLLPNTSSHISPLLTTIQKELDDLFKDLTNKVSIELRPAQISIKVSFKRDWPYVRRVILQSVSLQNIEGISILESSHSIDIIENKRSSKLRILQFCHEKAQELELENNCLCIGDKGQWPGNDYSLLSTPYSLSVDEVSPLPSSCWNFATPGVKHTQATLEYLSLITNNKNYMKFNYK